MASPSSNSSSSLTTMDPPIPDVEIPTVAQIASSSSLRKEEINSSVSSNEHETLSFRSLTSPYSHQMDATTPSPPNVSLDIPQWKKDLIQRRKTNIAKTLAANQSSILNAAKEVDVASGIENLGALSPTSDSKHSAIFVKNNKSEKLLFQSSRIINASNDTNKSSTIQNLIASSATPTTSIDNNMLKMPATLQLQQPQPQPQDEIESSCGGHYTHVNHKSTGGSHNNYTEKLPARSASVSQPEQQQSPSPSPVPMPRSVVVVAGLEHNSNDGSRNSTSSSSTLPQENVRFRKNLNEQRGSTSSNTTSCDSLLTSTSRLSSSLKVAAAAEIYIKSNKDNNSSAVCVSAEQQHSHIFQQKPASTTTKNISKGNNNGTSGGSDDDDDHNDDDDDGNGNGNDNEKQKHQLHHAHQLNSGHETDSLACAVNVSEFDAKEVDSKLFSSSKINNNKTNGNTSLPLLKSAAIHNKKPCGIASASVRSSATSASSQFIKNQNIGCASVVSAHHNYKINTKVLSNQNSNSSLSPSLSPSSSVAIAIATTTSAAYNTESPSTVTNNKKKMVAVHEMNEITNNELDFDPSEELQYGPGIVSKLRCRYLSLALRQTTGKQRLSMDSLRRATSLNNLLDDNGVHDEDGEEDDTPDTTITEVTSPSSIVKPIGKGIKESSFSSIKEGETVTGGYKKNTKVDPAERTTGPRALAYNNQNRSRHIKRGNDSLKRARSVEALLCEKSPWNFSNSQPTMATNGASTDSVTIEDKIINARERLLSGTDNNPPKRLTSIIDDTERPPPDLVKETLKIFEASANRRGRTVNRNSGGEVATKVANYKSIITQNKPAITFPKPPVSPKKSNQKLKQTMTEVKNNIRPILTPTPSQSIGPSTVQHVEKIVSPLSSTPIASGRTGTTTTPFRPKIDSTPIRNVGCVSSVVEVLSENSPDIIPRHKLLDKTVMSVDSPVTELAKSIEKLRIESPTTTTQTHQPQPQPRKDRHSRFSSESSERESDDDDDDDDDDSMDGVYEVNTEESISTKLISKSGLENIAKAGTSQQFVFGSSSYSNGNSTAPEPLHDIPTLAALGSTSTSTTVKQIGVIRPLLAEPPLQHVKNNCIEEMSNNQATSTLTSREIEKNRINNEKKIEKSGINSSMDKLGASVVVTSKLNKIDVSASGIEDDNSSQTAAWSSAIISKKKRNPAVAVPENNTMVFNFKDRKEVPDYIENDGLIFKHKRELPKPNESGFVLLGDLSLETSTDPDDEWPMCPPSPCDVEFENAHIIIDGKSNIKNRPKEAHFHVQFNDTLTSTFEYPSESSVIEDSGSDYADLSSNELNASTSNYGASANVCHDERDSSPHHHHHVKSEEIIQLPHNNKVLGNLSLGSAPLGSYTPITAKTENIFQLGVTRVPNSQSDKPSDEANLNEKQPPTDYYGEHDNHSLEYLKPASDDLTIAYSEGSLKTDLLY